MNRSDFILLKLSSSKFRSSFHLNNKMKEYVSCKGLDKIKDDAYNIINTRIKPKNPKNDGKQTPMKGHPVFIAQHACACCCRGCLEKWYPIPKDRKMTSEEVEYGSMPTVPADPTKDADAEYTYPFAGWDNEVVAVTGDATYTATYNSVVNTYTVLWQDEDGTTLETDENVPYNTVPTYNGITPTKTATAEYTYAFSGWTPAVEGITD